jgi:ribosomal protein S18 acetylase RimI-like enzyme
MDFREATLDDIDSIQRVARASWHKAHGPILGENAVEKLLNRWYSRDRLKEPIRREDATMFVAIDDNDVVGFTQGGPTEDGPADAAVSAIYVLPKRWGEGLGTELLDQLFDIFRTDDCESVWLTVMADNDVGRSFYDRHSFDVHEERTVELAGQEVDDVVLTRGL